MTNSYSTHHWKASIKSLADLTAIEESMCGLIDDNNTPKSRRGMNIKYSITLKKDKLDFDSREAFHAFLAENPEFQRPVKVGLTVTHYELSNHSYLSLDFNTASIGNHLFVSHSDTATAYRIGKSLGKVVENLTNPNGLWINLVRCMLVLMMLMSAIYLFAATPPHGALGGLTFIIAFFALMIVQSGLVKGLTGNYIRLAAE